MARAPFTRGLSQGNSSVVYTEDDDTDLLGRDNEIFHRSSSGVGSCTSSRKPRKKKRIQSENTSTSDADLLNISSGIKITQPKRRTKPREAYIASPKPLRCTFKVSTTAYGSFEEQEPLLQPSKGQEHPEDIVVNILSKGRESIKPKTSRRERFWSVVVVFLLPLIAGLTLIISVNVNSDTSAREINPLVFHYYTVGLISVYIAWLAVITYRQGNNRTARARTEVFEPLIPSHLLNGLALFGVCSSVFQVIMIVDFVKCSRSNSGLDKSYIVTACFEMMFVFSQIYMFYTLSRRRKQKLWFGNYFTMFTLAVNLTLWAGYFCASAVNQPDLKDVKWLRRYYYGKKKDLCASLLNNTGNNSRSLHELVSNGMQYKFTFAMEYSLLASALLLHLWLELETPAAGEFGAANKKWEVWRFGFIAGLFSLPLMGVLVYYSTVVYHFYSTAVVLYLVQCGLLSLILLCSIVGLTLFKLHYIRDQDTKPLKVDIILLCFSSLGFVVIDFSAIFATGAEIFKSHTQNRGEKMLLGVAFIVEFVTVCALTVFIFASYYYRAPANPAGVKAAKRIRQITSFCIIVSFGFWAMRTYRFRCSHYFDLVAQDYFGKTAWFAITQFSSPMCIFYHFHCAVCLSGILADSTVAGGHFMP